MKIKLYHLFLFVFAMVSVSCSTSTESPWQHPLYMANNDYWRQRIPVILNNNTGREVFGDIVEVKIGNSAGQIPIAGADAKAIRVTNSNGDEMMYRITDRDGKLLEKGSIANNSSIRFAVECKSDSTNMSYIYFDNPSAWPVGDYFKADTKINDSISVNVLKKEKLPLKLRRNTDVWFDDNMEDKITWQERAVVRTINYDIIPSNGALICTDIEGVLNRLHSDINVNTALQVTDGSKPLPFYRMGNNILFISDIPALTQLTNYIYFNSEDKSKANIRISEMKDINDFGKNLVVNPGFEKEGLAGWKELEGGGKVSASSDSKNGSGSVQLEIAPGSSEKEAGLEQVVPVVEGRQYLFASWIKCSDRVEQSDFNRSIRERTIRAQFIDMKGNPVGRPRRIAVNPDVHRDNAWSQLYLLLSAPEKAASVELQLVNSAPGTVWFDDIVMADVISGETSPLAIERKDALNLKEFTVWQQDPIVKVFQDDLPPSDFQNASISVAKNEYEPLQLVLRSPVAYKQLKINVIPPENGNGNKLENIKTGYLGYVPVNYPSNYINDAVTPAWRQKKPSGTYGSDGWVGMWPDPIIPFQTFDLPAFTTQPVWIEFFVPKNAVPGDYNGKVQFLSGDNSVKEVPFSVHVWDFQLDDRSHMIAEYDLRMRGDSGRMDLWRLYSEYRITPDRVLPAPDWKNENGKIIFDFTAYDKAASYYFDTLNFPNTYSPQYFYLFGWASPPGPKFGEKPYEGNSPYPGVDRSKLRPEFKKVYQSALKQYWDHIKAKGWDDKVVLYISDEPHGLPEITAQMRALCDMIHEVDRKIPIYVSCWSYRPEYIGYVDVWGVSNHRGPVEDLLQIHKTGDRVFFTTDGKLCTDTPYLGFERMLPYFCFKYGADEYEFWASTWFTFNPWDYGWHNFIHESQVPGQWRWTRYPNGDGYLFYPGKQIGLKGWVPSIRVKVIREGVEDYEYMYRLNSLITSAEKNGKDVSNAKNALDSARGLVTIPSAEGRYSARNIPDPYAVLRIRKKIAEAIESLSEK